MTSGIFQVLIEVALLVMKIIGVNAQKRKNLLDWAHKKMKDSGGPIKMKDSWKKIYAELDTQIEEQNKPK